jgi:hypothetical protein
MGTVEEDSKEYIILVGKPEGKRALERPIHKRKNNIKIYLKEVALEVV